MGWYYIFVILWLLFSWRYVRLIRQAIGVVSVNLNVMIILFNANLYKTSCSFIK